MSYRDFSLNGDILNVVLIGNKMVDEKRQSGKEGVVFKINFEKVYDHVTEVF